MRGMLCECCVRVNMYERHVVRVLCEGEHVRQGIVCGCVLTVPLCCGEYFVPLLK